MSKEQMQTSDLNPKTIVGKKIRRPLISHILVVYIIASGFTLVESLFDGRGIHHAFTVFLICLGIFTPIAAFGILYELFLGKVLAILAEDRLYFFFCEVRMGHRRLLSDGYVYYGAIKHVSLVTVGKQSHVLVNGDEFQIKLDHLGRGFIRKLEKMRADDPGFPFPAPGITVTEDVADKIPREGLFAELWSTYEKGELASWFDSETQIAELSECFNTLDITVTKNGHEILINVDDVSLYITANDGLNDEAWEDIPLAELADMEAFKARIQSFINKIAET